MTDNNNDQNKDQALKDQASVKKTLTLSGSKLSLGKNIDSSKLKESYLNSRTSGTAKPSSTSLRPGTLSLGQKSSVQTENDKSDKELSGNELLKRVSILKKAAEHSKIKYAEKKKIQERQKLEQEKIASEAESNLEESNLKDDKVLSDEDRAEDNLSAKNITSDSFGDNKLKKKNFGDVAKDAEEDIAGKKAEESKVAPKLKNTGPKKIKKSEILGLLNEVEGDGPQRTRSLASIKRAREKEKRKMQQFTPAEKVYREVVLPETITVGELANRMTERSTDVIKELMKLGVIAAVNQTIDADTAELVIEAMGHQVIRVQESDVENIFDNTEDHPDDLLKRAPVVTVMGHVDHGKTSLLDALKSTDVAKGEAGGITQHIGAYCVELPSGEHITFIDTPGHEAFTEMRTRGAEVTDIVILVVAADDGIKVQTIEAINHAKAAKVPIIVAINKIDKPGADPERVKTELLNHELVAESLGGDIMVVEVSALQRQNLDKLEEAVLLMAEMLELKANPKPRASGVVVESRIDRGKGVVTTLLVQRGMLRVGDLVVAGASYGKAKKLLNDKGVDLDSAGPSVPVEIWGLNEAPAAGDPFAVVNSERQARDITEYRMRTAKDKKVAISKQSSSLEDLFTKASGKNKIKELPIVLKGDVQGSIEAIINSLNKIATDEVRVRVLHSAVGGISDSDITLAAASNALVLGFNVRPYATAEQLAEKDNVDMRFYSVIYHLIDDIKMILSGMLSPIIREQYIGSVEIREVFNITRVGKIAGSYVTKGIIKRGAGVRLLRDNIVIHEGKLKTLKRFKDDVKEVKENFECGIAFENYEDIKVGDKVEVFELIEEKQSL